jgi:hypothetical protein
MCGETLRLDAYLLEEYEKESSAAAQSRIDLNRTNLQGHHKQKISVPKQDNLIISNIA